MLGAGSGNSAGEYLGTLADALSKSGYILVVNMVDLIGTELADLSALAAVSGIAAAGCGISNLSCCRSGLCSVICGLDYFLCGGHYFVIHFYIRLFPEYIGKTFSFHKFMRYTMPVLKSERQVILV